MLSALRRCFENVKSYSVEHRISAQEHSGTFAVMTIINKRAWPPWANDCGEAQPSWGSRTVTSDADKWGREGPHEDNSSQQISPKTHSRSALKDKLPEMALGNQIFKPGVAVRIALSTKEWGERNYKCCKKTEQREKNAANNQIPRLWAGEEAEFTAQTGAETSSVMLRFSNIPVSGPLSTKTLLRIAESFCLHESCISIFNKLKL